MAGLPPALAAQTDRVVLADPVFISDLHLSAAQPATRAAFMRFGREVARKHRELVILGDLFEYWAGDDDDDALGQDVAAQLAALQGLGVAVYLMHGNRDLLLGTDFCTRSGATLLADPTIATIQDRSVLLAHGDAYCTLDLEYLKFRAQTRNPGFQQVFLSKPLAERKAFIGQVRAASEASKARTAALAAPEIMDVTPAEIEKAMAQASVRTMIHGHTHRPATHHLVVEGQGATRWVLPDWDLDAAQPRGGYLGVLDGKLAVAPLP